MGAMIFGIISAALSAFSSFSSSMRQGAQQRNQAAVMEAQAKVARQNAVSQEAAKNAEATRQERKKSRLRRQFNEIQGSNAARLGAGNVEMTSGSAADVTEGNINNFAADMGDNAYAVALKRWEALESRRVGEQQAKISEANASYLKKSSPNLFTSLLMGGIGGAQGFATGYSLAGGKLGSLFDFGKK